MTAIDYDHSYRVRNFLDHDRDHVTHIRSEYTLQSGADGFDNIMLVFPNFLPNLRVSDSDGTVYPIMPNEYVKAMILKNPNTVAGHLDVNQLHNDILNHKKFLIWIKTPANKNFKPNEVRVIYLDYDVEKSSFILTHWLKSRNKKIVLDVSPVDFPVFWILKKPEGYDLTDINYYEIPGHGKLSSLSKSSEHPDVYLNKTNGSDSFYIKKRTKSVAVSYSFKPKRSITALPFIFGVVLTLLSGVLIIDLFTNAASILDNRISVAGEKFTLGIFILASTMVIPRLISHVEIRHEFRWWYILLSIPATAYLVVSLVLSWF